jgi:hypothetical protein
MRVKIFAFKVALQNGRIPDSQATLDPMLSEIQKMDIVDRVRDTASGEISLKEVERSKTGDWLLDFTKFRHVGPGRAPRNAPNTDFDLAHDEYFGEETAAIYLPATADLVLQYNHHGPRSGAIEQYFQSIAQDLRREQSVGFTNLSLHPVMRPDVLKDLDAMTLVKKIEFTMHVPGALQAPQERRSAVGGILNKMVLSGPETMSMKISAGRSKSFNLINVRNIVTELLGFGSSVTKLKVNGSADEDLPSRPLDLLGAQLSAERTIPSTSRKRRDLQERWNALRSVYDGWKADDELR